MGLAPIKRQASSNGSPGKVSSGKLLTGWPALLEFLSMSVLPDGTRRALGKMSLWVEGNVWKARLNDTETAQVLFLSAMTPDDLLAALDVTLETGKGDWQHDQFARQPKAKKA